MSVHQPRPFDKNEQWLRAPVPTPEEQAAAETAVRLGEPGEHAEHQQATETPEDGDADS